MVQALSIRCSLWNAIYVVHSVAILSRLLTLLHTSDVDVVNTESLLLRATSYCDRMTYFCRIWCGDVNCHLFCYGFGCVYVAMVNLLHCSECRA